MFLAQRTRQKLLVALVLCATDVAVSTALAWAFPRGTAYLGSVAHWLVAIPLVVGAYVALEFLGERFLSVAIWKRMPPAFRVFVLVCCIATVAALAIAASNWTHGPGAP
jgi:hypothetical protein